MSKLMIRGGVPLCGETEIHGSKNSVLPILAACCAVGAECRISRCPRLTDVDAALCILRCLGCAARLVDDGSRREADADAVAEVDSTNAVRCDIPPALMREMRSSIAFLGAMLTRCGRAVISLPGGCELGARPIDLHLSALARMGAEISDQHGVITCSAPNGLHGAEIALSFPSVGATENIITAAASARGTTVIENAACEPEIADLAAFLNACGARITGAGSSTVVIDGVKELHGCDFSVIPDRIETATYLACCAAAGGSIKLKNTCPRHLAAVISVLEQMGCRVKAEGSEISLAAPERLRSPGYVRTMPYPGFPTDAQAIMMAAACVADGTSVFIENIFDSRFKHAAQLCRMGACIRTEGRAAVIEPARQLCGTEVCATDLRGGAALMAAALAAEGVTVIDGMRHILRGYVSPERQLQRLGADASLV